MWNDTLYNTAFDKWFELCPKDRKKERKQKLCINNILLGIFIQNELSRKETNGMEWNGME